MSLLDDLIRSNTTWAPQDASSVHVPSCLPLVFRPEYDVKFCGLERLHPFDTSKWGRVAAFVVDSLKSKWFLEDSAALQFVAPNHSITDHELALVHSDRFIDNVKHSRQTVVATSEVCLLYLLPMCLIEKCLITPLRYQTTGTILGSLVALKFKVAINVGGGFHHCSARHSGGFCFFADITLAMRYVWNYCQLLGDPMAYILIVDCDAHQGNGYARDVLAMTREEQKHVYILDLYNARIYPRDEAAKAIVNREVQLPPRVEDDEYLMLLEYHLKATFEIDKYRPNLIIFNAGTDILKGDPLGRLRISPNGIIKRDQMVFAFAHQHNVPILMLLSGGYQRNNARVIANSILNLLEVNLIKPINIVH